MVDLVREHVPRDRAVAVLDVGCGAGPLVFQLAAALPAATLTGVDISAANIRAAESARARHADASRIRFERADYLELAVAPVDIIVADTALHFMRGGPDRLWAKLSGDLRPSGLLVCAMAYDGAYNRAIRFVRRALRAMRSAPIEALVSGAARLAFGRTLTADELSERTEYMYIPPEQLMTATVKTGLAPSLDLDAIDERDVPSASATQLRQRVTVFVKRHAPTR
jgi:trans-aconitate methyltransferase